MDESQVILIGLVATFLTWFLKVLASYGKLKPSRVVVNIVLYVVSSILAVAWAHASLPAFPAFDSDIAGFVTALWDYLNQWVALATPILGSATLIYNLLYEKVVAPAFKRFAKA